MMRLKGSCGHEFDWNESAVAPDAIKCAACGVTSAVYGITQSVSPQSRIKCACPSWTTPRECIRVRYDDPESCEECECPCHEREDYSEDWT